MEIVFKYMGEKIPNELKLLTNKQIGVSRIDDCPIYLIEIDVNEDLIDDLLFDKYNKGNYLENIKLFLRRFKTTKLLNGTLCKDMDKFVSFLQLYYDLIDDIAVMNGPMVIK